MASIPPAVRLRIREEPPRHCEARSNEAISDRLIIDDQIAALRDRVAEAQEVLMKRCRRWWSARNGSNFELIRDSWSFVSAMRLKHCDLIGSGCWYDPCRQPDVDCSGEQLLYYQQVF